MSFAKPGAVLSFVLGPIAKLFEAVVTVRGDLFDSKKLEIVDSGVPVISVGNITAGGTGKTPITSFLTADLRSRGVACAIISRGYGAMQSGPALVPSDGLPETARQFGDEPSWLASVHPRVPVIIGGRRPESIAYLLSSRLTVGAIASSVHDFRISSKRVVIADDAFQHRRLKRNLDVVILDATEPRWHYQALPLGRLREGFGSLKRANFIFISKTNLADADQLKWLLKQIKSLESRAPVIGFEVGLNGFVPLEENLSTVTVGAVPYQRVVLVSGIARPETFDQLVNDSIAQVKILKHFIFRDHSSYRVEELKRIEIEARELGAEAIIITEKDATKLGAWRPEIPCYVSRLVARPQSDLGEFHAAVDRLF